MGVSFEFLRRFLPFAGDPPLDKRMGRPILDLIREEKGSLFQDLKTRFHGLPSPIEDHLSVSELKGLCEELHLKPLSVTDAIDDPQTWVKALRRPAKTTADCCFFAVVKPDTAATATECSCSYVELPALERARR